MFLPALVTQAIDLRDDADMPAGTDLYDLFYICIRQGEAVDQFGMGFELIMVIYEKEQGIDLARRQLFVDKMHKGIYAGRAGRIDAKSPYRQNAVQRSLREKGERQQ